MHWMPWDRLNQPKCKGGMGFRDLRCFNLAMLGKQGWRLIIRPESLCAKVLKGRYFHDTDFMRATRKKHASSTWRAILAGREALQHGLIKREVNGEDTEIWGHRWISDHFDAKPITPRGANGPIVVSELLQNGVWNDQLIRSRFLAIDSEAILRQPISQGDADYWAWNLEKFGMYTVKSAYKLLHKRKSEALFAQMPSSSEESIWKKVRKLDVPPKVRVFWWRVLNEFLPTRQVLYRRHVEPVSFCEVCGHPEESSMHVLLECTVAKRFWEQTRLATGVKVPKLSLATWAVDLMSELCPKREQAVIMCGMWALWMMRNKRRHGELSMPVHQAVILARDTTYDLWQLCHRSDQHGAARAGPA